MDEVVYPVIGTFDDWAYAASKYPEIMTKCTNNMPKLAYPEGMTNGLVYLLEIGPKNTKDK